MVYNICQHFRAAVAARLQGPAARARVRLVQGAAASVGLTDAERANVRAKGPFQLLSFQGMMKLNLLPKRLYYHIKW